MLNPLKALKYSFNPLTAVDEGWNYQPKPPVLSDKKKRQLMANSALETPKSNIRAVASVFCTYPRHASWPERLIFLGLIGAGMYLTYYYVQEQVAFSQWMRGLSDVVIGMGQVAMEARPELIDNIINNYPLLQAEMIADPVLDKLLDIYPDSNTLVRSEIFKAALEQSPEMKELLRGTPPLEKLLMAYPGFAEKVAANPELLEQVISFKSNLGDKIGSLPGVKAGFTQIATMVWGEVVRFSSDIGSSLSLAYNAASGAAEQWQSPENQKNFFRILSETWQSDAMQQSRTNMGDALGNLYYSKDMAGMLTRFTFGALFALKSSQIGMMRWRGWTTGYYTKKLMHNRAYLHQKTSVNSIDNTGQRLQEDPDKFTEGAYNFMTSVQTAVITFASFSGLLLGLGPFMGVPGGYMVAAGIFAATMTAGMLALGWKMPNVQREKQMREAYLRASIDKVTQNAAGIALNKTEDVELELIKERLKPAITNSVRELGITMKMTLFNIFGNNATIPFPWLIAGIAIAGGTATGGTALTINAAFNAVAGSLSIVANQFKSLSYLLATAGRIFLNDQSIDLAHYQQEERLQNSRKIEIPSIPPPAAPA